MPNVQNVPMHTEKDEVTLTANVGTTTTVESFDFQGSYAFEDNFAAMVNGQFVKAGRINEDNENSGNGNLLELAVGYYKPLSDKIIFETYLGGGSGNIINRYDNNSRSKVGFNKIFNQSQIGFRSEYFDFILSNRLNWLGFNNLDLIGVLPENEIEDINTINNFGRRLFIEPAVTARIGNEPLKLQAQLTLSEPTRFTNLNRQYILFSIGLHATF